MTPEVVQDRLDDLAQLFKETCSYEKCKKDCSTPVITRNCSKDGISYTAAFWQSMLESLNNRTMIDNIILTNSGSPGRSFPFCLA
uniref:Uncharacterized protein n=1 Tax=Romanomermis culicivorax TaxID=13658 RepID=A0A915KNQ2_ROMCU